MAGTGSEMLAVEDSGKAGALMIAGFKTTSGLYRRSIDGKKMDILMIEGSMIQPCY